VLLLTATVVVWSQIRFAEDETTRMMYAYMVIPLPVLGLSAWWMFFSRLTWRAKWTGVGVVVVTFALFFALVRLDGFDGVMHPQFSWRWSQTAEERAIAHRKARQSEQATAAPATKPDASPSISEAPSEPTPATPLVAGPDDSPEFRGVCRDGVVTGWKVRPEILAGTAPKPLWRQPIGPAWSGFAVVGEFAFTQEQREANECVVCMEAATGREVWVHSDPIRFEEIPSGVGPRATPTVADGRVYTVGGTALLNCLDARTGKKYWSVALLDKPLEQTTSWGTAPSPLVWGDLVIAIAGKGIPEGADAAKTPGVAPVRAFDRLTGEPKWTGGTGPGSYAAPARGTLHGREQLFVFGGTHLQGLDHQTGEVLWTFPWTNAPKVNAALPIPLDESTLVIGSGYGTGGARLKFDGSTTPWTVTAEWKSSDMKLKFNDAVRYGGHVYGLDEGILACVDLATGKKAWKKGRYGYGQVLLVDDLLVVTAESGDVVLVPADPKSHKELARHKLIDGTCWNQPTLAGGRLFVRSDAEAACYEFAVRSEEVAQK
jgi:outer membrane protein assembly factor BamB